MNKFFIIILASALTACSTATVPFSAELSGNNSALVKIKKLDVVFNIKSRETKVLKIDGVDVENSESHVVSAGTHELVASCKYWETLNMIFSDTHTFNIEVKSGHTYLLESALATHQATGKVTCLPILEDQTKI